MSDLLTQLAEIRSRQGLEPISDPRVIQGFERGTAPPPPFMPSSVTHQDHFVDDDPEESEPPFAPSPMTYQSPLIAAANPDKLPPRTAAPRPVAEFELIICDTSAAYRGHAVELNPAERGAVVSTVLAALRRTLDDLQREVERPSAAVTPAEKSALQAPLPRKRGRPRKVRP